MPEKPPSAEPRSALQSWIVSAEDWILRRRAAIRRRQGAVPTVIPYSGYGSTTWVRVLGRVLYGRPDAGSAVRTEQESLERVRGWRSFTGVPVADVDVTVEINGTEHTVRADRGGVIDAIVETDLEPGWNTILLRVGDGDAASAPVFVVDPAARFGIVSDVDDTVMVTMLPRPLLAFWNTFVLDEHARIPTPGIAVFLQRFLVGNPGAPVLYLSTGAWNVAPTLTRFLSRNLYPSGSLLLTDWGPTHDHLFRNGPQHKHENLNRLADEFPNIRWLLLGDDGQHDEEIYRSFAADHPGQVAAVAIRQLSTGEAVLAGGRSKAVQHRLTSGAPWVYGPDGASLLQQLADLDLPLG